MQKPWGLSEPVPKAFTVHTLHHSQSRLAFLSAETLGLSEPVLRAIKRKGYRLPTPIQRKTLPLILQARAVVRGHGTVRVVAAASKQSLRSTQGLERMSCTVWEGSC